MVVNLPEIFRDGIRYVPSKNAAQNVGLVPDYISRMCRFGHVRAIRHAGVWYVDEESLASFLTGQKNEYEKFRVRKSIAGKRILGNSKYEKRNAVITKPHPLLHIANRKKVKHKELTQSVIVAGLVFAFFLSTGFSFALLTPYGNIGSSLITKPFGQTTEQLAAASSIPVLDSLALTFFRTVCPHIGTCPSKPILSEYLAAHDPLIGLRTKTAVAPVPVPMQTPTTKPVVQNVVNQPIVERIRETTRVVVEEGVSATLLDARLYGLEQKLTSQILALGGSNPSSITQVFETAANLGRIEHLDDLDLTDPTITGGTISTTALTVSGTATSTFAGGLNLTSGCLAINGTCITSGSGGGATFGQTWELSSDVLSPTTTVGVLVSASSTFTNGLTISNSTTTNATTTNLAVTGTASTSALVVSNLNSVSCDVKASPAGILSCGTDASGNAGFDFTVDSYASTVTSATTTALQLQGGLFASSTVRFGNAGVSPFFFDGTTGNLGLGTTTPAASLDITPSDSDLVDNIYWRNSATGNIAGILSVSGGVAGDAGVMILRDANTNTVRIDGNTGGASYFNSGGNVGIGTTSPYAKLSVVGEVVATYFTATSSSATSSFTNLIATGNASTTNLIVSNLNATSCDVKANAYGLLSCGTDATGAGNAFSFTDNYGQTTAATGTPLWAQAGIFASSTSHFVNVNIQNSTTTSATTTNLAFTNLTSALLTTNSSGRVVATTSLGVAYGGTAATSFSYGLVFSPGGTTALTNIATSSLNILTSDLIESGNLFYTDARVQAFVHASTTIPKTYTANVFTGAQTLSGGLTLSGLNGPLDARNGVVGATTSIGVLYGGTGLTTAPSYGQLLMGQANGSYALTATSSLDLFATGLGSSDFGDWTCDGNTCTLDADTVSDSEIDYSTVTLNDFTNDGDYVKWAAATSTLWRSTGLISLASSTIGGGAQGTGLTIFGGATTTGNFLVMGSTTLQNATSTNFFSTAINATNATTTSLFSSSFIAVNATTTNAFFSSLISTNATSTNLFGTSLTATNATTTNLSITGTGSTTAFVISNLNSASCDVKASAAGVLSCGTDADTAVQPFTFTTNYGQTVAATGTPIWAQAGIFASSTSYFVNLNAQNSTTTNATTTNLAVTGTASTSALVVSGLNSASCDVKASSAGVLSCGTDANNSFPFTVTGYGVSTSTIVGFTAGSLSMGSTTIGGGAQGTGLTIFGGATTTGNFLVMGSTTLQNATSTNFFSTAFNATNATTTNFFSTTLFSTNATSTNLAVTGTASTSALVVSGLNSASCDVKASTAGILSCGTDADTAVQPFSFTTNYGQTVAATGTPLWAQAGIFASSTSHFADADFINSTTTSGTTTNAFATSLRATNATTTNLFSTTLFSTNATTTNLAVTGISRSLLYANAGGSVISIATSTLGINTTDILEGSNLFFTDERVDDRVSALLQAGSGINLFYDDNADTLTISSTGGGGGTDVNWTFFNGSGIRPSTSTNQVVVGGTATTTLQNPLAKLGVYGGASFDNASSTNLFSRMLTGNAALFGASATSTFTSTGFLGVLTSAPTYPLEVTGNARITGLVDASHFVATSSSATSSFTNLIATGNASTTNLIVSNLNATSCDVKANAYGLLSCGTDADSSVQPFSFTDNYGQTTAATGTPLWAQAGIFASSTSYFVNLNAQNSTTTNATTTNLAVTGTASTSALVVSGLNSASCDVKASSAGVLSCGTDANNSFPFTVTGYGVSTSTIVGFTAGSLSMGSTTIGGGAQGTGLTIFGGATTTGNLLVMGSTTLQNATSTNFAITGTGSTTAFVISNLNSASCDVKASTAGILSCGTDSSGTSGGPPFDAGTYAGTTVSATGTALQLQGGLFASSTVRFGNAGVTHQFLFDGATGFTGIGTTTPWGLVSISPSNIGAGPEFVVGSTTRTDLIVTNAGRVGVGTSTPSPYNLNVHGTSYITGNVLLGGSLTMSGTAPIATLTDTDTGADFRISGSAADGSASLIADFGGELAAPYLSLGAQAESVRILYSGLVGIGETNPGSKLSVSGNMTVGANYDTTAAPTNGLLVEGRAGFGTTTPFAALQIATTTGKNLVLTDSGAAANLKHWLLSSMSGNLYFGTTTDSYATSTPAPFSISNAGLVTIPNFFTTNSTTTNATTTNLSVTGNASTTALVVSGLNSTSCDVKASTAGVLSCGTDTGAFPFTVTGYGVSTSTIVGFTAGSLSMGSTTIGGGAQGTGLTIFGGATTTGNLLVMGSTTLQNATSTNFAITGTGSTTAFVISNLNSASCDVKASTAGILSCGTDANGSVTAFTFTDNYGQTTAATGTPIWAQAGIFASSTSRFSNIIAQNSTTTNATTTNGVFQNLFVLDTDQSHRLKLVWNENASSENTLNLSLSGGTSRALTISGDVAINQNLQTVDAPTFAGLTLTGNGTFANATSTNLFSGRMTANTAAFGSTATSTFTAEGFLGIGTSTPFAKLSIHANTTGTYSDTLFAIASSTHTGTTTIFSVGQTGATTTNLSVSGTASSTFLTVSGLNAASCDVKASTAGILSCGTDASGSAGSDPFTHPTALTSATTSGLVITASSTIGGGTQGTGLTIFGGATTTGNLLVMGSTTLQNATTTNLSVTGTASTTALVISNTAGSGTRCLQVGSDGTVSANSSACGSGSSGGPPFTAGTYGATTVSATGTALQLQGGLYASSTVRFGNAGVAPFFYDGAVGNVGIGTTTPQWPLSVFSSTGPQLSLSAGAGIAQWTFRNAGGNLYLATTTVAGTATSSATALTILGGNGYMGLGTTSPFAKLSITDAVSTAQQAIAYDQTNYSQFLTNAVGDFVIDPSGGDVNLNDDNLWVCTGGACPSGTISGTGNLVVERKVGIGTSTPLNALDIVGDDSTGIAPRITLRDSDTTIGANSPAWQIRAADGANGGLQIGTTSDYSSYSSWLSIATSSGKVGIATSSPAQQFSIQDRLFVGAGGATGMGTATSTFQGDVKITGKLDVSTIDPPYTIDGVKYATYVPAMTGVKEETVATIRLDTFNSRTRKYEKTISFDEVEKGSDLWLFYQVTDFGGTWEHLIVQLTPAFDGQVFYTKDIAQNTLTISGSAEGEVSMRLTSNRYDAEKWLNLRPDQDGNTEGTHVISSKPRKVEATVNVGMSAAATTVAEQMSDIATSTVNVVASIFSRIIEWLLV